MIIPNLILLGVEEYRLSSLSNFFTKKYAAVDKVLSIIPSSLI